MAATEAMDVTTTNLANANTPGYARRRVVLEESAPIDPEGTTAGVDVQSIQSLRDDVLDMRINQTTSQQSHSSTLSSALSPVQVSFSDSASNSIGSTMNAFFSSLQSLSANPSDSSLRSNVLTAAENVASSFQSTASQITDAQNQIDQSVVQQTGEINSLLQQIATTNSEISSAQSLGQSCNTAEDQRSSLLTQLAGLIGYQSVNSSDGLTLTTGDGTPLVVGGKAYSLTNELGADGHQEIYAGSVDVTSSIQGGSLGGYVQARDQSLANLSSQLDNFAFEFAQAVNQVQSSGSDLNENTGAAFFDPPDTTAGNATGAASSIAVALTNGSQIAAAADGGASGDNSNLLSMIALQNQNITNGATPTEAFANLSFTIGNEISQANTDSTANGNILTQLQNQQGSVEGVSTDEESSNLILYERAYQAAAKVISTIDTLMGNVLDMGVTNPGY